MMRLGNISSMRGFRSPTSDETAAIFRIMNLYFASTIRVGKVLVIITCVIGSICLLAVVLYGWPMLIISLLVCSFVIFTIFSNNRCRLNQRIFRNGEFLVLDGYAYKLRASDEIGKTNVNFRSVYGESYDHWCSVRRDGVYVNTPLLLVWADERRIKHGLVWAFSPFMMTEEAAKLRW